MPRWYRKYRKYRKKIDLAIGCFLVGLMIMLGWLFRTIMTNQGRANMHASEAAIHEAKRSALHVHRGIEVQREAAREAALSAYHAKLNQKWEYAASHPWSRVEPDPPEPK